MFKKTTEKIVFFNRKKKNFLPLASNFNRRWFDWLITLIYELHGHSCKKKETAGWRVLFRFFFYGRWKAGLTRKKKIFVWKETREENYSEIERKIMGRRSKKREYFIWRISKGGDKRFSFSPSLSFFSLCEFKILKLEVCISMHLECHNFIFAFKLFQCRYFVDTSLQKFQMTYLQ